MAHPEQIKFCNSIKSRFPTYFKNVSVLDVGSLDINGNNRYLFENSTYFGIDIGYGKNVDLVVDPADPLWPLDKYDVVISTECLEHDVYYINTFKKMYNHLLPKGLLLFTAAGHGRAEHGTSKIEADASPFTNNYYKNITIEMLACSNLEELFSTVCIEYNKTSHDIYFCGIKL